jgi:hypothetical protein
MDDGRKTKDERRWTAIIHAIAIYRLSPVVGGRSSVVGRRSSSGRWRRLALTPAALAALPALPALAALAAQLADLDVGGLEGVAALGAERHNLITGFDIAQLPVHLLAHCAVGGELYGRGLATSGGDSDRVAGHRAHHSGHPAAAKAAATLATATLAAAALTAALAAATLAKELLRGLGAILLARPDADRLPTIEARAGHQDQCDNPDDSFP